MSLFSNAPPHTAPTTGSTQTTMSSLKSIFMAFFLVLLSATQVMADDLQYLAKQLAWDGIAPEVMLGKVEPELLAQLELDAEEAYFKNAAPGEMHQVIVRLRSQPRPMAFKSAAGEQALRRSIAAKQDRVLGALATKKLAGFRARHLYQVTPGFSAAADFQAIAALAQRDEVVYVEKMPVYEAASDPEADVLTQVDTVHSFGFNGEGVTIAIIDSGIDYKHIGLMGHPSFTFPTPKVIGGYDFGDDDADPLNDCAEDTHGTMVAGVAAGLFGVAPGAQLVHLKVKSTAKCDKNSFDGDVEGAIDWVVANRATYGIDILSMSFGNGVRYTSTCPNAKYSTSVEAADAAGILMFAASGNDNFKDGIGRPACHPSVKSVGAVYDDNFSGTWTWSSGCSDSNPRADEVTCYSNSASFLDYLAPATCAFAPIPGQVFEACFSGTSASTPYTAGVAALLMQRMPTYSADQIAIALALFGDPNTDPDNGITKPRVNAFRAFAFLPLVP